MYKASSWSTKKGKMRAADATLAGPLEPNTQPFIGRPVWLDRLLLMGPAVPAILRVRGCVTTNLSGSVEKRRGPVSLSVISSPSPTAATKCYAPIAHSQSNHRALHSTQMHTVDSQFKCQGMVIASASPAGTNIPTPPHPLSIEVLSLSPSRFLFALSLSPT